MAMVCATWPGNNETVCTNINAPQILNNSFVSSRKSIFIYLNW